MNETWKIQCIFHTFITGFKETRGIPMWLKMHTQCTRRRRRRCVSTRNGFAWNANAYVPFCKWCEPNTYWRTCVTHIYLLICVLLVCCAAMCCAANANIFAGSSISSMHYIIALFQSFFLRTGFAFDCTFVFGGSATIPSFPFHSTLHTQKLFSRNFAFLSNWIQSRSTARRCLKISKKNNAMLVATGCWMQK